MPETALNRLSPPVGDPSRHGLRCCLLSGGNSRRMGSDKALLSHPGGGSWLEATLILLARLGAPVTLLSGHPHHLRLAERLAGRLAVPLSTIEEPQPPRGPLLALQRLIDHHPGQWLLLCPVDMPGLTLASLEALVETALAAPATIHVAHDGQRSQPLLGIYPASLTHRRSLAAYTEAGGRALQGWLAEVGYNTVALPAAALRNVNHPGDLVQPAPPAAPRPCCSEPS